MADVIFMATPHGEAMAVAPAFIKAGKKVIDLSADFRLRNLDVFEKWYHKHTAPDLVKKAVYGLPELYREEVKKADLRPTPDAMLRAPFWVSRRCSGRRSSTRPRSSSTPSRA